MAEHALFPAEVTGKVPRITLTGHELLHVEQHRGLAAYQPEQLQFRTASGILTVTGRNLHFRLYSAAEALITGTVTGIVLEAEG